ncbi:MAG: PQQ-binding-like beta-propeller repeat protein, partial [Planctomycetes bacterium]|nr:PQQ-binding-like beta-propeller repeat protein [Planctomycetota bacterium]
LRLAVASAHVGDAKGAQSALQRLEKLEKGRPVPRLVEAVRADGLRPALVQASPSSEGWPMRLGAAAGDGHMANLPPTYTASGLSDGWFDELVDSSVPQGEMQPTPGMSRASQRLAQTVGDRDSMIERWRQSGRTPAGQVLVQGGHVFYKTDDRVACRDLATGKLKWLGWENKYQPIVPPMYQMYGWGQVQQMQQMRRGNPGAPIGPLVPAEIQTLGDRVHGSMSIVGDLLLTIEAVPPQQAGPLRPGIQRFPNNGGPVMVRQRENRLTAYEATTGKLKWVRNAGEKVGVNEPASKAGFLGSPIPYAKQLLVPIVENGSVWLASLECSTGQTAWRTMICEEPDGGASAWAPVGVAVEGGDVYIATGAGVVAALDALSGGIHWIALYPRKNMVVNPYIQQQRRRPMAVDVAGCWLDDTVVARGSQLLVMPSDADEILAFDRRNGELQWKTARAPSSEAAAAEYCLGVLGDFVYVAGPKIVRCYKISGGGLKWEHALSKSSGRGLLTGDSIYIPDGNEVVRLDPRVGQDVGPRELSRTRVIIPSGEPLGNLFTDGRQLLVLGPYRVYSLEGIEPRLARLAARIGEGDMEAQRERMRLYYRAGRMDEAIADLVSAYSAGQPRAPIAAYADLLDGIQEMQLSTTRPPQTIELLKSAQSDLLRTGKGITLSGEQDRKQSGLLATALSALGSSANTSTLLSAAQIAREEYLVEQVSDLLRKQVTPADITKLQVAAGRDEATVRRVAIAGLAKITTDEARSTLARSLQDAEPLVRLSAAWELANRGDRASLPTLVELLKSDQSRIRNRAFLALRESTGQTLKYLPQADSKERETAIVAWKQWLDGPGASAKLRFPLRNASLGLGRILVASMATNQVVEIDSLGKEVWRQQVTGPFGVAGTLDGHRLVANYSGRTIHEFDETGKEIWTANDLPGNPSCLQRLSNGNTLVVLSNRGQVIEIAPDKKIVNTQEYGAGVAFARRLENGNTLVCQPRQSRVIEFDPKGQQVATFQAANATAARRLENGNTLIAEQGRNRVVELSPTGQVAWSVEEVPGPWDVERLDNGNTIVSNSRGVEEFGPDRRVLRTWNYPSTYRISVY